MEIDPGADRAATRALLLRRSGLLFVGPGGERTPEPCLQAVEIEFAAVGYALSTRLSARLATLPLPRLAQIQREAVATLAAALGADRRHEPLFRRFPDGIPADTRELWWQKVLSHFLQAEGQPCLFCRRVGTCHVLRPCCHVVCDHCFDGASYSACPVCEHHVDRSSPFFEPAPERARGQENVRLKLLDLGESLDTAAAELFDALCRRPQALSPDDREALTTLLRDYGERVLGWLPPAIPLKENIALVFGILLQSCDPGAVLPVARRHLATATDVLRLIAALSGADPALQRETVIRTVDRLEEPQRWWGEIAELLGAAPPRDRLRRAYIPVRLHRFKVAKLPRPLRRTLLAILDGLDPERLTEDLLRHRSYWVWVGEFLHPAEYAGRFPNVARAFKIVRGRGPDGTPAPEFHGFYARLEAAAQAGDAEAMTTLLRTRPGELARRFDHALRVAGGDPLAVERLVEAFTASVGAYATPLLLTLRSFLPTRTRRAAVRVFWPKGSVAKGVSAPDERPVLPADVLAPILRTLDAELLRRFAEKPAWGDAVLDTALEEVVAPFNERTASPAAVALPRGSRVPVPAGKVVRLFLHWCQPGTGGHTTDLDLSVGFYDERWQPTGVCSYYQLQLSGKDGPIALSAGDLRDAPFPDGATEFVDLHREPALAAGLRYAVMVVNNYDGMPFGRLHRAFAGVMLRDDDRGLHFDPRTVELRFNLQGENGVFLPFVLDLAERKLHWLDVHAKGQFELNNVETSNRAITRICPELMTYFASGVRTSMYDLALLHAAARARRVHIRGREGEPARHFERQPEESPAAFLARLREGCGDGRDRPLPNPEGEPVFAALFRGDLELPKGSEAYVLFRDRTAGTMAASDLLG